MKRTIFGIALLCGAALLNGCSGEKADEMKSPESIRLEASGMRVFRLRKTVENYDRAIAEKDAGLKIDEEKLAAIPLEKQFEPDARALRDSIDRTRVSLFRLRNNRQQYADALENKQKR